MNFVLQKEQQQGVKKAGAENSERSSMEAFEKLKEENRNLRIRSINLQHELEALKRKADLIEASNNSTWQRSDFIENHEQPGQLTMKEIFKQQRKIVAGFRNLSFSLQCFAMLSGLWLVCEEKLFFVTLISLAGVVLVISGSSALVNMYNMKMKANTRGGADRLVATVVTLGFVRLIGFFVLTSMFLINLIYIGVYTCSKCEGKEVPPTSIVPACAGMRCILVQKIVQ